VTEHTSDNEMVQAQDAGVEEEESTEIFDLVSMANETLRQRIEYKSKELAELSHVITAMQTVKNLKVPVYLGVNVPWYSYGRDKPTVSYYTSLKGKFKLLKDSFTEQLGVEPDAASFDKRVGNMVAQWELEKVIIRLNCAVNETCVVKKVLKTKTVTMEDLEYELLTNEGCGRIAEGYDDEVEPAS
jgi:hypothetical protein